MVTGKAVSCVICQQEVKWYDAYYACGDPTCSKSHQRLALDRARSRPGPVSHIADVEEAKNVVANRGTRRANKHRTETLSPYQDGQKEIKNGNDSKHVRQ